MAKLIVDESIGKLAEMAEQVLKDAGAYGDVNRVLDAQVFAEGIAAVLSAMALLALVIRETSE